jgi:hypothetical protein
LLLLIAGSTAFALSVIMVEKRQAAGESYPLETTTTVRLPDGSEAQLVSCCGLAHNDSATYTVRDPAGYTVVSQKFVGGRQFLANDGHLISFDNSGESGLEIAFYDWRLNVIRRLNLVGVATATAGEMGSVVVLQKRAEGNIVRLYNASGESVWERTGSYNGKLYFVSGEAYVFLPTTDGLCFFKTANGEVRAIKTRGAVQFIGAESNRNLVFVSVADPAGEIVAAFDLATFTFRWQHKVDETTAGHCQHMQIGPSRYSRKHSILAVLLRCPGQANMFFVARFLSGDGQVLYQHKLGGRVDVGFYELNNKIVIISEGFVYNFAVQP